MAKDNGITTKDKVLGYLNQYNLYATSLRNWFVGYGIGALILFITNKEIFLCLGRRSQLLIVWLLVVGVLCQIILSLYNKYTQLLAHQAAYLERPGKFRQLNEKMSLYWQVDFILDFLTVVLFAIATWTAINAFFGDYTAVMTCLGK